MPLQGNLDEIQCSNKKVTVVDNNFAKLAARGVTIIFASGDSGSGYDPDGEPAGLYPSWPASSPWVTAVGSTRFVDQKVGNEEMATDQFGSGGGFSKLFTNASTEFPWQVACPSPCPALPGERGRA